MNAQTHNAALRAAARVAFSVTLIGCGGSTTDAAGVGSANASNEPAKESDEAIISSGSSAPSKGSSSGGSSTSPKKDAGAKPVADAGIADATPPKPNSCDTTLAVAFGDAGWVDPDTVSSEVRDCCIKEMTEGLAKADPDAGWIGAGELGPHGWACCQATNWGADTHNQQISMACTPWGPPVPPSIHYKRRGRSSEVVSDSDERLVA